MDQYINERNDLNSILGTAISEQPSEFRDILPKKRDLSDTSYYVNSDEEEKDLERNHKRPKLNHYRNE